MKVIQAIVQPKRIWSTSVYRQTNRPSDPNLTALVKSRHASGFSIRRAYRQVGRVCGVVVNYEAEQTKTGKDTS